MEELVGNNIYDESSWLTPYKPGPNPIPKMKVENCQRLTVGALGRGLLRNGSKSSGSAVLSNRFKKLELLYTVTKGKEPSLRLKFVKDKMVRTQIVLLATRPVNFGLRPMMICAMCGKAKDKLYLRPDDFGYCFSCRKCSNLVYESQTINRRGSVAVELYYYLTRSFRVEEMKAAIKRKVYDGKICRKLRQMAYMNQKWLGPAQRQQMDQRLAVN